MKVTDYLIIQDWMLDLRLTDKQEKLYALIWGYSRNGRARWRGTVNELATWLGCSWRHTMRLVHELEDRGLVSHEVIRTMKGTWTEFWAIHPDDAKKPARKAKIKWRGGDMDVITGGDMDVITGGDMDVMTDRVSIYSQDSNIINNHGVSNNARGARKPATDDMPSLFPEPKPAKRFTPPTVEQVAAYCQERGNGIDPQHFVDFYTSNGWKVGKSAMKDWKAAVRTWEARNRENSSSRQQDRRRLSPEERTLQALTRLQARDGNLHTFDEQ